MISRIPGMTKAGYLSCALIMLSPLSLSSGAELGLIVLSYIYYAAVGVTFGFFLLKLITSGGILPISGHVKLFFIFLMMLLTCNYLVAIVNGVDEFIWIARSLHLMAIPVFYLIFKQSECGADRIFSFIAIAGACELLTIFGSFFYYYDSDQIRRASDIEGSLIYSVFYPCLAFYALKMHRKTNGAAWLLLYLMVVVGAILTGTRVLLICVLIFSVGFIATRWRVIPLMLLVLIAVPLFQLGLFDRFDLSNEDNVVTISSKIEEVQKLWSFFMENPIWGVGIGHEYQVSLSIYEYNYSHNILMFYLGYSGMLGFAVFILPFVRFLHKVEGGFLFLLSFLVFYFSSTTYTNVKHSILIATILLMCDKPIRNGSLLFMYQRPGSMRGKVGVITRDARGVF